MDLANAFNSLGGLVAVAARLIANLTMADEAALVVNGTRRRKIRLHLPAAAVEKLERAMIAGEDRRFLLHSGVDLYAIGRAVFQIVRSRRQGASTIEQQLVRTIRRRYEFSVGRKFSEICLACHLSREVPKRDIVRAYLAVAYFGWRAVGVQAALRRSGFSSHTLTDGEAAEIIAQLRYPLPQHPSSLLAEKIRKRASWIASHMRRGQ